MRSIDENVLRLGRIPRKYLRQLDAARPAAAHALGGGWTGVRLKATYPQGVPLAIWHDAVRKAEMYTFQGSALKWARTWGALGRQLAARRSWSDGRALAEIVLELNAQLVALIGDDGPSTKIRDLAVFCHGQTTSILYGKRSLRIADLDALVAAIAPALAPDVRVVLYACNTGRNPEAPPEAADWQRTTLGDGGPTSFAAALRDRLVRAGKPTCQVWSHTTAGHTANNSALRCFRGADGVGSAGVSFARVYVHDWRAEYLQRGTDAVTAAGFKPRPQDQAALAAAAEAVYCKKYYAVYGATCRNKELLVDGQRLAMAAPMNPDACAQVIRRRWEQAWQRHRVAWGREIARAARLHA